MNTIFNLTKKSKIAILESTASIRSCVWDTLKKLDFSEVTSYADPQELLRTISVSIPNWIISGVFNPENENIMTLLKLMRDYPDIFRSTRVSLIINKEEQCFLPLAFDSGLFSYHFKEIPSLVKSEFDQLLMTANRCRNRSTLVAAEYLRRYLGEIGQQNKIIQFEKNLLGIFPANQAALFSLAEAYLQSGDEANGNRTLAQIRLMYPSLESRIDEIVARFFQNAEEYTDDTGEYQDAASGSVSNILGIDTCIIIDPDSTVQFVVERYLREAGVPTILSFSDGEAAWKWIQTGGKPDLVIQEWRIPKVSGVQFIQRLRGHKLVGVPIIIISSLTKAEDHSLIKEMGATSTVEKPIESERFYQVLISAVQAIKNPVERDSVETKIRNYLTLGNIPEAKKLFQVLHTFSETQDEGLRILEGEFAFAEGNYQLAADLATAVIKQGNDDIQILDLLGKSLMKLGNFLAAERVFEKAQQMSPMNVERLCLMSEILLDRNDPTSADQILARAKGIDKDCSMVNETDAKIALVLGDIERATQAIEKSDSLTKVLGYMNNKGISYVRTGKFDEGTSLYQTAIRSLPGAWSNTHDAVTYNLAMAYCRVAKLDAAQSEIAKITAAKNSPLGKKVDSLSKKIAVAIENGTSVRFASHETIPPGQRPADEQKQIIKKKPEYHLAYYGRGELCCYKIFEAGDLITQEGLKLSNFASTFQPKVTS
jgi:DNA-binding NtrC family response regulator/thioredoxin-like negative regulator of GroEL